MHDSTYRLAVAWQNVAYNQPPHTRFFLGHEMDTAPTPAIYVVEDENPKTTTIYIILSSGFILLVLVFLSFL